MDISSVDSASPKPGINILPFGKFAVESLVALGWAVCDRAELAVDGTELPSMLVWFVELFDWAAFCTVAVPVGVVIADMGLIGLTGLSALLMFVGLVGDFTQLSDVVTQGDHTG